MSSYLPYIYYTIAISSLCLIYYRKHYQKYNSYKQVPNIETEQDIELNIPLNQINPSNNINISSTTLNNTPIQNNNNSNLNNINTPYYNYDFIKKTIYFP